MQRPSFFKRHARLFFFLHSGYDSGPSSWSGYPQYAGEGLHVVPPVSQDY